MREIDFEQLTKLRREETSLVLLDCRAREYWLWETIEGSGNLRWKEIPQRAPRVLPDKDQLIVTFCQSAMCPASTNAYQLLDKMGYSNVHEYIGGIEDWRVRGGKIVTSPENRISQNAFRFSDQKFYGQPVGSYLVEDDERLLLIDGPQYLTDANEDFILSFGKPISIFLTHGSTGGVAAMFHDVHGADIYLHEADRDSEWLTCTPTNLFNDSFDFSSNLRVLHTPGHSPGSCCVYDFRSKILFSGDHVQGESPSAVWDFVTDEDERGDVKQQLSSLRLMNSLDVNAVYPFHYKPLVLEPKQAIQEFLSRYKNY